MSSRTSKILGMALKVLNNKNSDGNYYNTKIDAKEIKITSNKNTTGNYQSIFLIGILWLLVHADLRISVKI